MLSYLLGIILIFISIYYFIISIARFKGKKRWKVVSRLQNIEKFDGILNELEPLNRPFKERIILPALQKLGKLVENFTPTEIRKSIKNKLLAAGYSHKSAMTDFLTIQGILFFAIPLVFVILAMLLSTKFEKILLAGILGMLLSLIIPILILNSRKTVRQKRIRKDLPDMMDLLVISVEAGLSFDMALAKVTEKIKGALSEELTGALAEVRIGKLRRVALREMAERTGVDELISFVGTVYQAEQLGVSIGNVLRVQSESMRTNRRQKIEEAAAKVTVKILFPLVFFLLPSLFIIILGPAAIQLIKIFSGVK